ncbi:MAG: AraC family transcriptional regulator [Prevotellaceae bacterium]|jgi:AraC-like DNA-binding protein|nr:AraC family transcriptional regulator [Prevotellaceae bacterium]
MLDDVTFLLLNVGYAELNADWNWKEVCSPFARIYYVKDGGARTKIGNNTYALKPHHLYLTPPFSLHDDECDGYFTLFYIHFFEKAIRKESVFDMYDFPVEVEASPLDLLLVETLMQINPGRELKHIDPKLYDNPPTLSRYIAAGHRMPLPVMMETRGILYQIMSRFFKAATLKSGDKDVRIKKCLKFIHENIDQEIPLSRLAGIACMSEGHFIRMFKKEMHCPPVKYINRKKIEKTQFLLLTTDMPVRDIALELSVDNISYFNKLFKQYTGKTPGAYRNEYGADTPPLF